MSTLLSKEEFQNIFDPHVDPYVDLMYESLTGLNNGLSAMGEIVESKTKSMMFHAIAIKKAERYFTGKEGVTILSKYQTIQIVFKDKAVGRIKKVNKEKLSSNTRTYRINSILANQLSLFPNMDPFTCIELTYRPDNTWTNFEHLGVVCRVENDILWDINYGEAMDMPNVIPTSPIEPTIKPELQIKIKKA